MSNKKLSSFDAVTTVEDADEFYVARSGAQKKIAGADLRADLGGSSPGVGDSITVDINTGIVVPNDGTNATIAWDGSVFSGGAGSVTLSVDKTRVEFVHDGIYTVSAYAQFGSADTTGRRGVAITQDTAPVFSGNATQNFAGAPIETTVTLGTVSWTGVWQSGDGAIAITALCEGAAGAVTLDYAYLTAVMVAPLGT